MTSIYDFGLPLVIGSFGLITLFLLCCIVMPNAFPKCLGFEKCSNRLVFSYLVVLGFSFGLLFEFVSDKIASWVPAIESEKAIRTKSLFQVRNIRLKMSKHHVISMSLEEPSLKKKALRLEQWIRAHPLESPATGAPRFLKPGDLTDFAMCTYYACKGAVYQDPQYFSELMRIQDKIYFSRSMAVVSLVAICLALLSTVLYTALWHTTFIRRKETPAKGKQKHTGLELNTRQSYFVFLALFLLLYLLIYAVSRYSYADYESSSARRFYNYYISKLEFPNQDIQTMSQ